MTFGQKKVFLLLSALILLSDISFVAINYYSSQKALYQNLEQTTQRHAREFFLALDLVEGHMQQFAMLIAAETKVQDLFSQGVDAVKVEGGGPGGPKAKILRSELYSLVENRWKEVTKHYNVRQLHFHLGPGSVSFLRVHKPQKFGDRMDDVRFTIVDCNRDQKPTSGFEVGRVYAGIRGVVPVYSTDESGQNKHIGALEAGTSFKLLLEYLQNQSDAEFAVLLDVKQVEKKVWPDFLQRMSDQGHIVANRFIESTTDNKFLKTYLSATANSANVLPLFKDQENGSQYAMKTVPLRDYLGTVDPTQPDIGSVLIWLNADAEISTFWQTVKINILFAIVGFLTLEVLLFFAIRKITSGLQKIISDQSQEIDKSHSQLLQSEKMASIGQLAAGVAHEINNPMGFISGNLRALQKYLEKLIDFLEFQNTVCEKMPEYPEKEEMTQKKKKLKLDFLVEDSHDLIDESLDGAERVKNIVNSLKAFSNIDRNEVQAAELNSIVENTLQIVGYQFGDRITVEKDLQKLPDINCYPQQFSQLFMNILMNASQAITEQGTIKIRSWTDESAVYVSVSDNGCGIEQEHIKRIFEPFFTTHDVGKGTGLGLSMAWDIAQNHNGSIEVESVSGEGATFTIKIPIETELA